MACNGSPTLNSVDGSLHALNQSFHCLDGKQNRKCTCNIELRRVSATTVAVEKQ